MWSLNLIFIEKEDLNLRNYLTVQDIPNVNPLEDQPNEIREELNIEIISEE
jgi:hypothetical protein